VSFAGRLTAAIGALVALVGTFMPWLRSGTVDRSSYDLVDVVERLGFSPGGFVGIAVAVWPIAPLALVSTVVAQWPGWTSAWSTIGAATSAGITSVYVGGIALAVLVAPDVGLFRIRLGAWLTLVGASVMLVGACVTTVAVRWGRPIGLGRQAPASAPPVGRS
jgi:hypothetical protein